jgi:mannose-6-phosphate isomerase-like protein (cupin superfamily)
MEQRERSWGEYDVLSKTKILKLNPNSHTSLQYHNYRHEFWTILEGHGMVIIGESKKRAYKGDTFFVKEKQIHQLIAGSKGMNVLEISVGKGVYEEDIVRLKK